MGRNAKFSMFLGLCLAGVILYFWNETKFGLSNHLVASYSYQGPTQSVPGNPQLVRVEVLVRDSPMAGGVRIKNVDFNGRSIPLQPPDLYGNRGTGSFQVPPGKYKLHWVVQRDKVLWPRVIDHEEEVDVNPRDLWLQVEIVGEEASIR